MGNERSAGWQKRIFDRGKKRRFGGEWPQTGRSRRTVLLPAAATRESFKMGGERVVVVEKIHP